MSARRAEIAGAGIGGLTAAAALAQRGWSVRVHERNSDLREIGAGIFLWENALRALEGIGGYEYVAARGHVVPTLEVRDEHHRTVERQDLSSDNGMRLFTVRREDLYAGVLQAARDSGVDIVTESEVVGARPAGVLEMADGSSLRADLVVGADGVNSRIRNSLGLTKRDETLPGGAVRVLVERTEQERTEPEFQIVREYWNRERRFLYVPVAEESLYLAMGTTAADVAGSAIPIDKEVWSRAFPHMAWAIERIVEPGRWDRFRDIRVTSWYRGRVAIVGDAAHAQPPHLAQGAALSMCNALALAEALRDPGIGVEAALASWEERQRPLASHTQRWTRIYGFVVASIPSRTTRLRSATLGLIKNRRFLKRQLYRAARHDPLKPAGV